METTGEILNRVLTLSAPDRAYLAHQILLSLDGEPPDAQWDEAWQAEIEQRSLKVERSESAPRDWRAVMDDVERELGRERAS